jgi:hypothetical protein
MVKVSMPLTLATGYGRAEPEEAPAPGEQTEPRELLRPAGRRDPEVAPPSPLSSFAK